MCHEVILILIILAMGILSGVTVFLDYKSKSKNDAPKENGIWRFITSSVGASILVPLLLNMLSSDLIRHDSTNYDRINYFIFAGFCFIAGYFSNKFIYTIGNKILKDVEKSKRIASDALVEIQKTTEKVDLLVSNDSEVVVEINQPSINLNNLKNDSRFSNEDVDLLMDRVLDSFNGKFKFRTISGIATEINKSADLVKVVLNSFEKFSAVSKIKSDGNHELWALTGIGQSLIKQRNESK